jgi:hypothetical protein
MRMGHFKPAVAHRPGACTQPMPPISPAPATRIWAEQKRIRPARIDLFGNDGA